MVTPQQHDDEGDTEMNATAKTTAHSNCTHPKTKTARAACRKGRATVATVLAHGVTLEIKTVHISEIRKSDKILVQSERGNYFASATHNAFRPHTVTAEGVLIEHDEWRLGSKSYALDSTVTIAADPIAVHYAQVAERDALMSKFRSA